MLRRFLSSTAVLAALVSGAQTLGNRGPWEIENSGTTAGLRGIHAVSGGIVWASGTGGTVLRSEDSGYEWQPCAVPPEANALDFRSVWAWDAQNALALSSGPGSQSRLYQTTDGCSSWKLLFANPDAPGGFWDGMVFLDRQHGLIYGDPVPGGTRTHPVLFVTLDGGRNWTPERSPELVSADESFFAASNSAMTASQDWVWLGTSKARVLRTRRPSGGDSIGEWQSRQTPLASGNDSSGVFSLAFRDQKHGVAVGGNYRKPDDTKGNAAYSSDGGEHWNAAVKPPHGYRSAVAWDTTAQAWISAGSNGSDISYDDGKSWQWLDSGNWNALSLPWAAGPHGQIGKLGTLPAHAAAAARVSR